MDNTSGEYRHDGICPRCHKPYIYVGDIIGDTENKVCQCYSGWNYRYNNVYYQTGWVCPICGKVNAPWKSECDGPHFTITYTSTSTKE